MNTVSESVRRFFSSAKPLPSGMYHYLAPQDDPRNFRLHLRIDPGGNGMLIINASTILHLNQTAAEYAYHLVKNSEDETIARVISSRYKVTPQQALIDFHELKETMDLLITRDDLDPEVFLEIEPTNLVDLAIPLRLDCALTYRLPENVIPEYSPHQRVQRELSTDEWNFIIDKAWKESIPHILFTGGEPTLRDDLPLLLKHAEINGQVSGLLTDGHKLIDPTYLNELLQNGLDHVLFLLQPESNDSWLALEFSLKADLFVTTHVTLTPANENNINTILERLALMGVQSLSLSCTGKDLTEVLRFAEEKAAGLDLKLVWDLPVPFSSFNPISLSEMPDIQNRKSWLYIEPDGDVKINQESDKVLGNFLNDPIDVLWNTK